MELAGRLDVAPGDLFLWGLRDDRPSLRQILIVLSVDHSDRRTLSAASMLDHATVRSGLAVWDIQGRNSTSHPWVCTDTRHEVAFITRLTADTSCDEHYDTAITFERYHAVSMRSIVQITAGRYRVMQAMREVSR
jgi:hypothetical protein